MRCAIYTRVSTDEQARSDYSSLRRQYEICLHYIDINAEKDWKFAGLYEDAGYSGKDFRRPGIQDLLRDVRDHKLDVVVTYKIDRISRSLKDFYDLWDVLQENKVGFVSATQHFDTSDSTGMLMLNILLSFAQFERELTRERTMSKMQGRAEKGLWNGGYIPIGFDYSIEDKKLVPSPAEMPIVEFVYSRMIETRSPSAVANETNLRGYRTKTREVTGRSGQKRIVGGKRFNEDMVKAIVQNPVYKGAIRYDGVLYPAVHQGFIDEATWADANKAIGVGREDDNGLRFKDDHVHLLKGILKCGHCGLAMTPYPSGKKAKDGSPYLYYACVSFTKDGRHSACPIRMVPAREFEGLIKRILADLGKSPEVLQACIDAASRDATASVAELREVLQNNRNLVGPLTFRIRRIIEIMTEEDLISDDLREEYKRLVREKEQLLEQCERLVMDIERRQRGVLDADLVRRSLLDFERLIGVLSLDDQKELFQLLIREVQVDPFDPSSDEVPEGGGELTTRVRSRWYRLRMKLHQLPIGELDNHHNKSSDNLGSGSPKGGETERPYSGRGTRTCSTVPKYGVYCFDDQGGLGQRTDES